MEQMKANCMQPRKVFSRLGFALVALLVITFAVQTVWFAGPGIILGPDNKLENSSTWMWLGNMIPLYGFAVPVFLLILRPVPVRAPEKTKLSPARMISVFLICVFVMYTGNIIGTLLSALLSSGSAQNPVVEMTTDSNPLRIVVMVLASPVLEELVFRKVIIDRTCQFGERTAIIFSGLMFGLFHLNFFQFFYAFGLGVLFGYLYIRSGKIWIPAVLHIGFNSIGAILAPAMLKLAESEMLANPMAMQPGQIILMAIATLFLLGFMVVLFGLYIAGLVMLCLRFHKAQWNLTPAQIPTGQVTKTVYWNVGVILFACLCALLMAVSLFI